MSDTTLMGGVPENTNEGATTSQAAPNATDNTAAQGADTTQVAGQQAEGAKGDTQAQEGEGNKAPEGAPEKYEFKPSEGMDFDNATLDKFSEVAKELNITQDNAQKVLDKMAPVLAARQAEQFETIKTQWESDTKADKEIGGEKLGENLAIAKKALEKFGTPELQSLLAKSGLGNNPEIIRAFYRAGKAISEDSFVGGANAPKNNTDFTKRLYNNSTLT